MYLGSQLTGKLTPVLYETLAFVIVYWLSLELVYMPIAFRFSRSGVFELRNLVSADPKTSKPWLWSAVTKIRVLLSSPRVVNLAIVP